MVGARFSSAYHRTTEPLKFAPWKGAGIPRTPAGVRLRGAIVNPELRVALNSGLFSSHAAGVQTK